MTTSRSAALAVALVLLLAACGGGDAEPESAPTTAAPAEAAEAPSAAPSGEIPEAAREQLDWFLGVVAGGEVTADEYDEHFSQVFRDELSRDQLQPIVDQLHEMAPLAVADVSPQPPSGLLAEVTAATGQRLRVVLGVDDDGRIQGLFFQPADPPQLDDPPQTVAEAADRLAEMGEVNLAAATVDGTECTADVDVAADELAPIASASKLYVLGAVADAVAADDLEWYDVLTLTADDKSLPSGQLQTRPDGSTITVREASRMMIAISDNTATDLLIRAVGRGAVEAALADYGHAEPAANIPFLTTRELFALKAAAPEVQQRWIDGDETERRAVLDELADVDVPGLDLARFGDEPVRPDELEWFASPLDLCRVLATLMARAEEPGLAPVAEILTANPGVPAPEGRWQTIAFKGGSEGGLVATAWLVADTEGNRYTLTGAVVNPDEAVDTEQAVLLMAAARDLLPAGG